MNRYLMTHSLPCSWLYMMESQYESADRNPMDEFLTEFKKGQMRPAYYVQGGYRVLEVQNNDKKVQNSIKIPFTFPARSDSMYL